MKRYMIQNTMMAGRRMLRQMMLRKQAKYLAIRFIMMS